MGGTHYAAGLALLNAIRFPYIFISAHAFLQTTHSAKLRVRQRCLLFSGDADGYHGGPRYAAGAARGQSTRIRLSGVFTQADP